MQQSLYFSSAKIINPHERRFILAWVINLKSLMVAITMYTVIRVHANMLTITYTILITHDFVQRE